MKTSGCEETGASPPNIRKLPARGAIKNAPKSFQRRDRYFAKSADLVGYTMYVVMYVNHNTKTSAISAIRFSLFTVLSNIVLANGYPEMIEIDLFFKI